MRAQPWWPRAESDKPTGGFGVGLADGSTLPLLWAEHDKSAANATTVACPSGPSSSSSFSSSSSSSSSTNSSATTLAPHPSDRFPTRFPTTTAGAGSDTSSTPYAALPRRRKIAYNLARMLTTAPRAGEDLAVWVGVGYTVGATLWVLNGFFAWLPLAVPGAEFPGQTTYGTGITSLLGVLCFETPAFIAYLIAVNDGVKVVDDGRGIDGEREEEGREREREMVQKKENHDVGAVDEGEERWHDSDQQHRNDNNNLTTTTTSSDTAANPRPFRYLPQRHHLTTINFWGSTIQLLGCTLFVVTGIVVQPGIYENLSVSQLMACLWIPLIVASAFFITASILFILDRQDRWYRPAPQRLGWWIGVWSLIGSVGFE